MKPWTGNTPDDMTAAIITLQRRFPGSSVWFGQHTFRWWAMLPTSTRWVLLEAVSPMQLAVRMHEVLGAAAANDITGSRGVR